MISWNSIYLEVTYSVLGWISFFFWSLCFYPQVLLNYRRKSVVRFNFDFPALNLTKHTSYLIYNAAMFFSPEVQSQYHDKYGIDQRGNQKISKTCAAITVIIWASSLFFVIVALPSQSWLWLITIFNTIQVIITLIKYILQVVTNFKRKSTVGWTIGFIFFDFFGGLFSFGQMFYGKLLRKYWQSIAFFVQEGILFDLLFVVQHYVLYPEERDKDKVVTIPGERQPFIGSSRMEGMKVSTSNDEDTGTGINNLMIVTIAETSGQG